MKKLKKFFEKAPAVQAVLEEPKAAPQPAVTVTASVKKRKLAIFEPPPPEIAAKLAKSKGTRPGRECSTCEIGTNCPEFEDGSACAYTEEFEALGTRSKADLSAVIHSVVQKNIERWQFAQYAEQRIHGGAPMPEVSRLGKEVLEQVNMLLALDEQEHQLSISGDAEGTGNVLQSLFGSAGDDSDSAIEVNPQLPEANPVVNPIPPLKKEEVPP